MHVPRRRCVGCGLTAPKSELLRMAVAPELDGTPRRVVLDRSGTMPGRGAYLCRGAHGEPAAACLAVAARRGGIARALHCAVRIDLGAQELVESVGR